MQWHELGDQPCSISRTLSVIGDRWTLLILRDCFDRVRRFDDFQERLGIGRPILASRLKKLVDEFVLTKVAYQTNPSRYEYRLTPKGLDLYPVIMAILHWGDVYMAGKKGKPKLHLHLQCNHEFDPVMVCSECVEPLQAREVRQMLGPGASRVQRMEAELKGSERPKSTRTTLSGGAKATGRAKRPALSGGGRPAADPDADGAIVRAASPNLRR